MKSSSGYEIYHNTLSSCLDEIENYVQSKGYQVGDYFPLVNHVAYGQTERTQLEMIKNGKVANTLAIQIYRMDSGRYELNCYPVRRFSSGGSIEEQNYAMIKNDNKEIMHHSSELSSILKSKKKIPAWSLALVNQSSQNLSNVTHYLDGAEQYATGGYTRPPFDMVTSGVYAFGTKKGTFFVFSFLFERENDTEDSIQIQDDLRDELGSILIKNSAWKRLSSGKSVKAKSAYNDYAGTLTRIDDVRNSNQYIQSTYDGYRNYGNGGSTEDGIDLFEDYDNIPPEVQAILNEYEESFEDGDYQGLEQAQSELNAIGYTFDFYVDGQAYDLRPIGTKGKMSEYETGGAITSLKVGDKFLYKFDNKIYEIVSIEDNRINLHNTQGMWWDNRSVTNSLMDKWIKTRKMIKRK